jgi:tetratricopeptide (TPR) repeat protein
MTIAPDKSDEFNLPVAFSFRDRLTQQQYASNLNAKCWEMVCLPGRSLDDYRRAYKLALIAQALQPNSGPIKNTLAMAPVRLGNHKEALTRLAEARKIHGIRPGDYFVAAVAYRQTGKNDRAQEVFDKARELMQEAQDKEKQTESLRDLRMLEREVAQLLENQ